MPFNNALSPVHPSSVFYPVNASNFASTPFLSIGSVISSVNTSQFLFSGWFKPSSSTFYYLFKLSNTGATAVLQVYITGGTLNINVQQSGLTFRVASSSNPYSVGAWNHFLISADTNFSSGNKLINMRINGVPVTTSVSIDGAAIVLNYSTLNSYIVSDSALGFRFAGDASEIFFQPNIYQNVSILANCRRFISTTKRPVFLGANGSTPLGSQPLIYLKGSGTGFNVNSGSGGNYTTTGTLATSTTTPSAP